MEDGIKELEELIARVRAAQRKFATYSQAEVDAIFKAAALAANSLRIPLAKMAVEETGMGVVEDKVIKNNYAAEYIYKNMSPEIIDINMGCPFPPVALHRRGSGILMYPDAVAELMRTIEEFPELSYSVKMRLGWQQNDEWKGVIEILNNASLSHICLHARIGKQQYKGDIDLDAFTAFYANCKHPIIFNGDITTVNDIQQIRIKFPALKGIMIGRGLLARPYLSTIVDNPRGYTTGEIIEKLQLFHNQLYEGFKLSSQGDAQLVQRAKSQWEYFLPHAPRKERKAIVKSTTPQRYEQAVANLFEALHRDVNSFEL